MTNTIGAEVMGHPRAAGSTNAASQSAPPPERVFWAERGTVYRRGVRLDRPVAKGVLVLLERDPSACMKALAGQLADAITEAERQSRENWRRA